MDLIRRLIDLFLHLDKHLGQVIHDYGTWTYLILFTIIFCETGLVVTPFLPGDSLLFVAGAFAALAGPGGAPPLDITFLIILLSVAAIAGDTVNYWAGHYIGPRAFTGEVRFLKKEYLDRTHRFYEHYGAMTIILARFVPIIRTFAPFVAGIGAMNYRKFITYNVVGGIVWVSLFTLSGYFFGNLEVVKKNFSLVLVAIVIISVMPMVVAYLRERTRREEPAS